MANNLPRLGGGVAKSAPLSSTPFGSSGISQSAPSTASILASGINDLMKSAIQVKTQMDIQRNEEDKIRAVSQAEIDHLDANNAFDGGSSDADLNSKVADWRSSGLTDSEVRLGIKNYKFNKAKTDLGINDDNKADDANVAYFNTFSKLELKALSPMLAQDRKLVQEKISNMNSSYARVSDDDLQTKYNNITTANKSYGMGEKEAMGITMQSAFDLARNGDDTLLRELHNVKTSTGERLLDTLDGSAMFSKLNDNLLAKKEHDVAVARKEADFQQEVKYNEIYTNMVESKDLHSFKINMDDALETGSISAQQHHALSGYYKTATDVSSFPKTTDRGTLFNAITAVQQGTYTLQDLNRDSGKFNNSDFEYITKSMAVNNPDSQRFKSQYERVDDVSNAISSQASIQDNIIKLQNPTALAEQGAYVKQWATQDLKDLAYHSKRPATDEEIRNIIDTRRKEARSMFNENKKLEPVIKTDTKDVPKVSDNVTGRTRLENEIKKFTTPEQVKIYIDNLSPSDRRIWDNK